VPRHAGPLPEAPTTIAGYSCRHAALAPKDPTVFISEAFAQAAPAAAAADSPLSSLTSMLPLVLMFVVLYFVMIRPQMKRAKEAKAMIDALAKGDEVVTAGGMLAKVNKLGESFLTVEIANGVEIQIQRTAVAQVLPKGTIK
jgi:preprotein translocase subunit YajC